MQQKKARVLRREGQGSLQTLPTSLKEAGSLGLNSPWLGTEEALVLHMGTRRNGKNSRMRTGSAPLQTPTVGWASSKSRSPTDSPLRQ